MVHKPPISCQFYEPDGVCDRYAGRHKSFFGIVTTLRECLLTLGDERIQECSVKKRWDRLVKQPPKSL